MMSGGEGVEKDAHAFSYNNNDGEIVHTLHKKGGVKNTGRLQRVDVGDARRLGGD